LTPAAQPSLFDHHGAHHAARAGSPSQEKASSESAIARLRWVVRDVAERRRANENGKAALHRSARMLGLTDRVARALFYAEDGFAVAACPKRVARVEAGYQRFLVEEAARLAADLAVVNRRIGETRGEGVAP